MRSPPPASARGEVSERHAKERVCLRSQETWVRSCLSAQRALLKKTAHSTKAGWAARERPNRPGKKGGLHPNDRNEVEDSRQRVAAHRDGTKRERRPHRALGRSKQITSSRERWPLAMRSRAMREGIVTEWPKPRSGFGEARYDGPSRTRSRSDAPCNLVRFTCTKTRPLNDSLNNVTDTQFGVGVRCCSKPLTANMREPGRNATRP